MFGMILDIDTATVTIFLSIWTLTRAFCTDLIVTTCHPTLAAVKSITLKIDTTTITSLRCGRWAGRDTGT